MKKIKILLEPRNSEDPQEIIIKTDEGLKTIILDLTGDEEIKEEPESKEEPKEEPVRHEVAEIKATVTVSDALEEKAIDEAAEKKDDKTSEKKKKKARGRIKKILEEGGTILSKILFRTLTETEK